MRSALVALALLSACGQPSSSSSSSQAPASSAPAASSPTAPSPSTAAPSAPPTATLPSSPTAAPPAPQSPAPQRRVQSRDRLEDWMKPLPKRGLLTAVMGLAGQTRVTIDADAKTLATRVESSHGIPPKRATKKLTAAELDALWKLAEEAWRAPPPKVSAATDFREVVVAVDGDQVMLISVQSPLPSDEPAGKLADEIRRVAGLP